jgi:hypothetical protein
MAGCSRNTLLAWAVFAGLALPATLAQSLPTSSGAKTSEQKTADQAFKNIEVLKGVPAEQLIPSMQFINASLGVECEFCHVLGAFEKDDKKPKARARKMMEMMFAINKDNFDGQREVTCYSCHRGASKPQTIPAIMAEETPPAAANAEKTTAPALPAVDQVINK